MPVNDRPPSSERISVPAHAEAMERFILFWGEMASRWGINRTMAQIHALLYASEEPLDTDAIMERLSISRGNANMNLRSLSDWNLVRKVNVHGSRKDYYTAEKDVWEITTQIVQQREQREVKPVRQQLEEIRATLSGGRPCDALPEPEAQFCRRIEALIALMEVFEGFTDTLIPLLRKENAPMIRRLLSYAGTFQSMTGSGRE